MDGCRAGVGGASFFAGCGRAFQSVDFRKSAVGEVEGESFLLRASAEPVLEGFSGGVSGGGSGVGGGEKGFLLANGIAVWDVIASCRIVGSSDSSIRDVAANDVAGLLQDSRIEAVFCNGAKSWELYHRYCEKACQREAGKLPSTSPANAAWSPERLIKSWGEALLPYVGPGRKG